MHGMSNVVYTVLLRAASELLVERGRMAKATFDQLVDDAIRKGRNGEGDFVGQRFVGDDDKVQRGISGALVLVRKRLYADILQAVRDACPQPVAIRIETPIHDRCY